MISESFQVASSALNFLKTAYDHKVSQISDDAIMEHKKETDFHIRELTQALMVIQTEAYSSHIENLRLKQQLEKKESFKRRLDGYSLIQTEGGDLVYKSNTDEPHHVICPTCVEDEKIFILTIADEHRGTKSCPNPKCNTLYRVNKEKPVYMPVPRTRW